MRILLNVTNWRRQEDGDRRADTGAVLVEFAFIVPILMMLLFGIIQFGVAYDRQQTVTASARQGARFAIVDNADRDQINARVKSSLATAGMDSTATIVITPVAFEPCDGRSGEDVSVKVTVPHKLDIPFVGRRTATLVAESIFSCE